MTETDIRKNFAFLIEIASSEAIDLLGLVSGDIQIEKKKENNYLPRNILDIAGRSIKMALAKQFLFSARRARRVCEQSKDKIGLSRQDRNEFLKNLQCIVDVRDVNEHGFDPNEKKGKRPKNYRHDHHGIIFSVDETSLIIQGPEKIFMGPLNLFDVITVILEMRQIAGFHTLPEFERAQP